MAVVNKPKTSVKIGFETLREGHGRSRFFRHAVMTGSIAFLALAGCMTIVLGLAVQDYGIDRAFGDVTGVQAIAMLRGLMLDQIPLMLFTAGLWGVLSGLNDAGLHAANPGCA